jgi:hypothetical protein
MASLLLDSDYDLGKTDLSFQGADINAFVKVATGVLPIDLNAGVRDHHNIWRLRLFPE